MKVIIGLVLVLALSSCTFRPYLRDVSPTQAAIPPCFTGEVCAVDFEGAWGLGMTHAMR